MAMEKEAGFDVSKGDWLRYQANQTLALSDEDLERVAGGADCRDWTDRRSNCGWLE